MAELDGSGQIEKAYIYLNGQAFAVLDYGSDTAGELAYIHADHLGTPQGLSDESGNIVWLADYSPFGLAIVDEDPDLDGNAVTFNLRFPGQYYDGETGFHYNYFRDYDPSTGRYVQSDPIGLGGGLNTYGYVYQNPLRYTDPTGEFAPLVVIGGGALVGAVAQGVTTAINGGSVSDVGSAIVGGAILGAGIGIGAVTGTLSGVAIGGILGVAGDAISAGGALGDEINPDCP